MARPRRVPPMPAPNDLVAHWGYAAIFVVAALGNLSLPVSLYVHDHRASGG